MEDQALQPQPLESVMREIDQQQETAAADEQAVPEDTKVATLLEGRIKEYREGKPLEPLLKKADVDNEQIGRLFRVNQLVAKELEGILGYVRALEKAKSQNRRPASPEK